MAGPKNILGYYSVSPGAVAHDRVPEELARALGRYDVSGYRLARLAVDVSMQGKGLGKRLLMRAGARAISAAKSVGGVALLIGAKGENVARWYERFGAVPLRDDSLTLFLHLRALEASIEAMASELEQS